MVGLDVGEIEVVAFVKPLKYVEYKPDANNFELVEHWDDAKWHPVAAQTMFKRLAVTTDHLPKTISAKDAIANNMVFLLSNSPNYGELAEVAAVHGLETHGRINSKC